MLNSNSWNHLNGVQTNIELLVLDSNTWNHLAVCKQMSSGSFKTVT